MLLLFLVGFQNIFSTIAINKSVPFNLNNKDTNIVRVLSWNVRGFDNPAVFNDTPGSIRRKMFEFIKQSQADILCLQEYTNFIGEAFRSNNLQLKELGYVYSYKTDEISRKFGWGSMKTGTAIFSKIPITDSGKIMLGDPSFPEHLAFADIVFKNKPIRIFSAHFKSLNLFASVPDSSAIVPFHFDSQFVYEAPQFQKIKVFGQEHSKQALIIKKQLNSSPHPLVFTADMNSVPTSFPYHIIAKDLQDVFVKKGCGLGTTLDSLPKTLRIDFLMLHKKLSVINYRKDEIHLSDHFPQIADITWKKDHIRVFKYPKYSITSNVCTNCNKGYSCDIMPRLSANY